MEKYREYASTADVMIHLKDDLVESNGKFVAWRESVRDSQIEGSQGMHSLFLF